MILTPYIIITTVVTVTGYEYTVQCWEKQITVEDESQISMESGDLNIKKEIKDTDALTTNIEMFQQAKKRERYIGGNDVNICKQPPDFLLKILWDVWQLEEFECPIQPQSHSYAQNITAVLDVPVTIADDDVVTIVIVVYRGINLYGWLRAVYECKKQ